jgi:hypothetical protein
MLERNNSTLYSLSLELAAHGAARGNDKMHVEDWLNGRIMGDSGAVVCASKSQPRPNTS